MQADAIRKENRLMLQQAVTSQQVGDALRYTRELMASGKAADVMFCASALRPLTEALVAHGHQSLNTYVVRSVTIEPMVPYLTIEAVLSGYVLNMTLGGYGSYMDDLLNPHSDASRGQLDIVLVLLDLEDIAGSLPDLCAAGHGDAVEAELHSAVSRVGQMLRTYRGNNPARLVMQGLVVPHKSSLGLVGDANLQYSLPNAVKELNQRLAAECRSVSSCVFFDVDQVAADFGRAQWTDPRMFLASRLPLAQPAFATFAKAIVRTASALLRAPRKVLCTDLDNTLWGGIVGEDGPGGIATGSAFPGNCFLDYQRYLKQLNSRGVLLAIASKNNQRDVEEVFRLRSADMAIGLDDFVGSKIGWMEKAQSLRELAAELSLGLDSFVFVDDNPVECEAIRQLLPQVSVVQVPADEPWKFTGILAQLPFFDTLSVTTDDVNRLKDYKAKAERDALSMGTATRDEFLQSLGIVCTFVSALDAPLARSVQLLAKTNQFNLTTRRHSATVVERFATDRHSYAVAIRVRDRFGDAGVVGLALASKEGEHCRIDSLLLSCRVIGRGIETALLARVAEWARQARCKSIMGEYIQTEKNSLCSGFYTDHGFNPYPESSSGESRFYSLDLETQHLASPPWLSLEGKETHELTTNTGLAS